MNSLAFDIDSTRNHTISFFAKRGVTPQLRPRKGPYRGSVHRKSVNVLKAMWLSMLRAICSLEFHAQPALKGIIHAPLGGVALPWSGRWEHAPSLYRRCVPLSTSACTFQGQLCLAQRSTDLLDKHWQWACFQHNESGNRVASAESFCAAVLSIEGSSCVLSAASHAGCVFMSLS